MTDRLPVAGAPVPAFDLPLLSGGRISPAQLAGTPAVLALWGTDCSASRLALQGLEAVQRDYAARGVRVLVVADDGDRQHLRAFMDSAGVSLPVAYATGELHDIFDAERRPWENSFGLPSWLVLHADGRVAGRALGVPRDEVERGQVRLGNVRQTLDRALEPSPVGSAGAAGYGVSSDCRVALRRWSCSRKMVTNGMLS